MSRESIPREVSDNPFELEYGLTEETYAWTQTEKDISAWINVPPGTRAKQLDVKIKPTTFTITFKGQTEPFFHGEWTKQLELDDCFWSMDNDGNFVELILTKHTVKEWWPSLFKGHRQIDLKKIEGSQYLDASLMDRLRREHNEKKAAEKASKAQA